LPELPSLRFGRAQAPPRRAYRPAPEGLELMFAGYDRVFGRAGPVPPPGLAAPRSAFADDVTAIAAPRDGGADEFEGEETGQYALAEIGGEVHVGESAPEEDSDDMPTVVRARAAYGKKS